jgi:hypothetical protein
MTIYTPRLTGEGNSYDQSHSGHTNRGCFRRMVYEIGLVVKSSGTTCNVKLKKDPVTRLLLCFRINPPKKTN